MVKAKKGKRSGKDDDLDSDADVENQSTVESTKAKTKPVKDKKKKKGDVDDLADELDDLKMEKPNKGKEKKGKKPLSDIEDDEKVVTNKNKPKEKKKKGKKARDSDSDNDEDDEDSISTKVATKKNKANSKKNKKKNEDDSEDESIKVKGKTKKGKKVSTSDEEFDILPPQPISNKQKVIKSGFALLNMDDDDDDEEEEEDEEDEVKHQDSDEEEEEKKVSKERSKGKQQNPQKNQEPQGKKGKKAKKKHDSDDEIEKVLAELEMEYSGKKHDEKDEVKHGEESKDDKKKKKDKNEIETKADDDTNEANETSTVKTAAQKKKEKKEREKQKKLAQKKTEQSGTAEKSESETAVKSQIEPKEESTKKAEEIAEADADDDEKKKKKKGGKEDPKDKGKGPGKKMIAAMQEALKKLKEDEERAKREEEERIRQEEIREKARLEQLQLEQERKEKKKLKEKQRKERLKAEGKLLTTKQKQDRARTLATLEYLKARGSEVPDVGEKKTKSKSSLGTRLRPNKIKQQSQEEKDDKENKKEEKIESKESVKDQVQVEIVDEISKTEEKSGVEVKDSWDADSTDEPDDDKSDEDVKPTGVKRSALEKEAKMKKPEVEREESSESDEKNDDSQSNSADDSEDDSVEDKLTEAEKRKECVRLRIQNRRIEAEKKKSLDNLRAAVVCVLGHVDTGKTKILDKLRKTNVQDGEAGGITQQIGATNVPIDAIIESTKHVKGVAEKKFKIPGLLIIDTPGHESFSNLRNRGSSLCDIAILVVDIMHGLEPQTIESINLLKSKKCPFVVALNKIDRLYDWQTMNRRDVQDIIASQAANTQREFERRSEEVIVQFAEQGLNAALFYKNPDPRSYVSLVPTSAITGEGMGNLLSLIVDMCQGPLAKRLMYSEELQATVLEVKALPGLGTTIDCILVNGMLKEGDTMILAGTDGPIVTQIRSLLMPQPLKELRVKNAYIEHREIKAAQGVKIAARESLEKAIAGLNLLVAQKPDEVEFMREEISRELSKALAGIRLTERGVYVQASTLGALEALLDFLKSSKIPYAGIKIGPVVKKDVMKASIMLEHDSQYATILAFDVKIERDAQEQADLLGVKIFQADIIYHLFDKFTAYRDELKQRKRDEHKHIAVFPCKLRILPQFIFNSRDPIIVGVMVEAGIVKEGTPVCVPSKDFIDLGVVTSIEHNHKAVETARKGQEVCVKIEPVPGEAPKMFGRHFDETDLIVSKISRQSIDACKDYFRDDLMKTDWQLMVELKKLFQIL